MNDYFKSKYIITDNEVIKSWIIQNKNEKGICLVDWKKVNNNYIKCCDIHEDYIQNNSYRSKKALGTFLNSLGIISCNKKISGKSYCVYVGISNMNE